jgi:type I restriction enzyme R subunit
LRSLDEAIKSTEHFLKDECKFDLLKIVDANDTLYRIKYIQEGYNAICSTDETKAKFGVLSRELFKKYKALMPDQSIYKFRLKGMQLMHCIP